MLHEQGLSRVVNTFPLGQGAGSEVCGYLIMPPLYFTKRFINIIRIFSSFVNGKKTCCGVARMNNAFSTDGGISFKTIGVILKEKKR